MQIGQASVKDKDYCPYCKMVNKEKEHPGYDKLVEALKGLSPSNLSIDCLPYKVNEYLSEENTDIEINHIS